MKDFPAVLHFTKLDTDWLRALTCNQSAPVFNTREPRQTRKEIENRINFLVEKGRQQKALNL